jgi:hypothetical protein
LAPRRDVGANFAPSCFKNPPSAVPMSRVRPSKLCPTFLWKNYNEWQITSVPQCKAVFIYIVYVGLIGWRRTLSRLFLHVAKLNCFAIAAFCHVANSQSNSIFLPLFPGQKTNVFFDFEVKSLKKHFHEKPARKII